MASLDDEIMRCAHWPTDVLVGWALGGALGWAIGRLCSAGAGRAAGG